MWGVGGLILVIRLWRRRLLRGVRTLMHGMRLMRACLRCVLLLLPRTEGTVTVTVYFMHRLDYGIFA